MSVTLKCPKHPKYKAIRAPKFYKTTWGVSAQCPACYALFSMACGNYGIKVFRPWDCVFTDRSGTRTTSLFGKWTQS